LCDIAFLLKMGRIRNLFDGEQSHDILMTTDISKESVKKLLNHWIEHNESHSASFRERATQVAAVSSKAAADIEQAAVLMDQCTEKLKMAMNDL